MGYRIAGAGGHPCYERSQAGVGGAGVAAFEEAGAGVEGEAALGFAFGGAVLRQALTVASTPVGSDGLVLDMPQPVERLPDFALGHVSVQDAAAQWAAPLLLNGLQAAGAQLRLLDACAAPGGKTGHLLD